MQASTFKGIAIALLAVLAAGCAGIRQKPYDYTAFKESKPRTILVLPPLNSSPDIAATYGMLSQTTYPLAESGYYVLPVTLVDETFKQNGLTSAHDIHNVALDKLQEIFGADAALYIDVKKYGTSYVVINSVTTVTAEAKLVDLRNGNLLWKGSATASSNENQDQSSGSLIGMMVFAVVKQVIANATDASYDMAGIASARLLAAGQPNGILYGPRSPRYDSNDAIKASPRKTPRKQRVPKERSSK